MALLNTTLHTLQLECPVGSPGYILAQNVSVYKPKFTLSWVDGFLLSLTPECWQKYVKWIGTAVGSRLTSVL